MLTCCSHLRPYTICNMTIKVQILQLINSSTAWAFLVIPVQDDPKETTFLIAANGNQDNTQFELELIIGKPVVLKEIKESEVIQLLKRHYPKAQAKSSIDIRNKEALMANLIQEAKSLGSSDIHIEPYEKSARIRYRIDGKLVEKFQIKNTEYPSLVNKIKIFAHLDIAEKRLPQDGRILFQNKSEKQELRVSTLPTIYGEKIVLRLLGNSTDHLELTKMGFNPSQQTAYKKAIEKSTGIVLISGPTGSGKTTTLYATLKHLNHPHTNIMTVEDPIEYTLEGINQVQLKEQINLTFATALKSFLRQDPDIIMLGEIRDSETAQMAIRAALTGHLVLSTIHTNSAWGTINRLVDMGVPSFLVANTLNISVAQRLIRLLCKSCKEPIFNKLNKAHPEFGKYPEVSFSSNGCEECNFSGYKGRKAIYETIENTPESKSHIIKNSDEQELTFRSKEENLPKKAWELFFNGETTLSEITSLFS